MVVPWINTRVDSPTETPLSPLRRIVQLRRTASVVIKSKASLPLSSNRQPWTIASLMSRSTASKSERRKTQFRICSVEYTAWNMSSTM